MPVFVTRLKTRPRAALILVLSLSMLLLADRRVGTAANPTSRVTPSPTATAAPTTTHAAAVTPSVAATPTRAAGPEPSAALDRSALLTYLGEVVRWHQQLAGLARAAQDPGEQIYAADDRRLANEALQLAFDFAHAVAPLLEPASAAAPPAAASPNEVAAGAANAVQLSARRAELQNNLDDLQDRIKTLNRRLSPATAKNRAELNRELLAAQAQFELTQSRIDSLDAMIAFQQTTAGTLASGLVAEIDELQRASTPAKTAAPSAAASGGPGLLAGAQRFLSILAKQRALANANLVSRQLLDKTTALHATVLQRLNQIDAQGLSRSLQANNTTTAAINQERAQFQQLTQRGKTLANALLPLSKELVTLRLYVANLKQWREKAHEQARAALRELALRGSIMGAMLLAVFVASIVWHRLTVRYVQDLQRRHQLLRLRRFVVGTAVILILLVSFAASLGSFATIMGFAAAGIAVALQNVILSVAGYFYLSGRFGIRVGDRVQIAGVNGDVLEIGFFKITLMELVGDERGYQTSGRAVIFPNSIVFQPSSNFFRQLPGANFGWREMRFTVAADTDYRLAEKRLGDVVNDVFARYRDVIQREAHQAEDKLNLRLETPRPRTRLQLGPNGLEIVIRYPVILRNSMQVSDDITRRLIDALATDPALRLATIGTPI